MRSVVVVSGGDVTSDVGLYVSDVSGDVCWVSTIVTDISDLLSDVSGCGCELLLSIELK